MFATLMESTARRKRETQWLPASAAVHLLLLGGLAACPPRASTAPHDDYSSPHTIVWVPISSSNDTKAGGTSSSSGGGGATSRTRSGLPVIGAIGTIDVPDLGLGDDVLDAGIDGIAPTTDLGAGAGSGGTSDGGGLGPLSAGQVEKVAATLPGNPPPTYPRALRSAGVEGSVVMRFVVDTTGAVEPGSRAVVRSDHPLFTAAVIRVLATHRFIPAEARGRKVRMLVEQRFEFALDGR